MLMERGANLIAMRYRAFARRQAERETEVLSFCASRLAVAWRGKLVRRGLARCAPPLTTSSHPGVRVLTTVPSCFGQAAGGEADAQHDQGVAGA